MMSLLGAVLMMMATPAQAGVASRLFIDSHASSVMKAGQATDWVIEIYNPDSSEPIHHFHLMHEKEVHLIVVSEDLASFAHIHPMRTGMHKGLFEIRVNEASTDPDNFDALQAVQLSGRYYLFSEAMPMGMSMVTLPLDLKAEGAERVLQPLVVNELDSGGSVIQDIGDYRVTFRPEYYLHCHTYAMKLNTKIERKSGASSTNYAPVTDLEPWLASYGHAILVSEQGDTARTKKMLHLHAVWPLLDDPDSPHGPDVELAVENHNGPMVSGVYKIWLQFKHQGKVLTVPVVLNVQLPKSKGQKRCYAPFLNSGT